MSSPLNFSVQAINNSTAGDRRPSTKITVKLDDLIKSYEPDLDFEPPIKRLSLDGDQSPDVEVKIEGEDDQTPPILLSNIGEKSEVEKAVEKSQESDEDAESIGSSSTRPSSQHPLAQFGLPTSLSVAALCSMLTGGGSGANGDLNSSIESNGGPSAAAAFIQATQQLRLSGSPFGPPPSFLLPPLGPLAGIGTQQSISSSVSSSGFPFLNSSTSSSSPVSYMHSFAAMSAAVNAAIAAKDENDQNNKFDGTTVSVNSFPPGGFPSGSRSASNSPANGANSPLACAVCGDTSSGKHYGILACNGCSGFFKRSVRRRLIYRCQAGTGDCVVDKAHRNQCQACRLRKCMSKGMNKDAVQNERQPRNTATIQNVVHGVDLFPVQQPMVQGNRNSQVLSSTVEFGSPQRSVRSLVKPSDVAGPSGFGDPPPLPQCAANAEIAARVLFATIKWTKNLPSFVSLPPADQMILLMNSWSDLFVLSLYQWSLDMEKCPLLDGIENVEAMRLMVQLFERFKAYGLDQGELTCLKAIVLFRSETRGLAEVTQVERSQDQAQIMLQQQISRAQPSMTRFGRLLLLIPGMHAACPPSLVEHVFMRVALGEKTLQSVIADIFKS